jgi:Xaa-Pro aminopeptidase
MLTTHPSIMLGSYLWDEERLPRDEFDIRLSWLRKAMQENDWRGIVVYGDAREHGALAWFSNFIPPMRWALALFPATGEPLLLASRSSRDVPQMRATTWIADVRSAWEWQWFDAWAAHLEPGTIGAVGFDLMTPQLFSAVEGSISGKLTLVEADGIADAARAAHRPREIGLLEAAAKASAAAGKAFLESWERGADVETAALAAEGAARGMAAHDVRTLVSRDGGRSLEPYQARFDDRPGRLLGYVAVKYLGYWGEVFVASGGSPLDEQARRSLAALVAELRPGVALGHLAEVARAALAGANPHPALSGGFGHRIGLSLCEGDVIREGAVGKVQPGTAYALRAGAWDPETGGAIVSAIAVMKPDGKIDILACSPNKALASAIKHT